MQLLHVEPQPPKGEPTKLTVYNLRSLWYFVIAVDNALRQVMEEGHLFAPPSLQTGVHAQLPTTQLRRHLWIQWRVHAQHINLGVISTCFQNTRLHEIPRE